MRREWPVTVAGLVIIGLLLFGDFQLPDLKLPSLTPSKVTAVTYVYEKDSTPVPLGVKTALSKLNSQGINANLFEVDTTDGSTQVPDQYAIPLAAAKEVGLPAAVASDATKAIKTVKNPQTEAEVLGVVK